MDANANKPIELLTINECARRAGLVSMTLRRAIALRGVRPDGILIEGSHQIRSPLFVAPRLAELTRLVKP
jgi:hypothetical protein